MTAYLIRSTNEPSALTRTASSASTTLSATTTAADLLGTTNAALRIGVAIENFSDQLAFVAIGTATASAASATNHAYLIPANRVLSLNPVPSGALNARLETGTGSLTVVEYLR